jgi:hypothetical protein
LIVKHWIIFIHLVFNRPCWSKSRYNSKILCSVCFCYRSPQLFSANYCCSSLTKHVTRQVCDTCVHQHILSKLYSCLTSSISCPELNCRANFSQTVICHILLNYDSHDLLNQYLREQQWQGKSDEWIKRFATRCPACNVPIEKNGGCDEMICIRCQTHFYWSKAKRYGQSNKKSPTRSCSIIHPIVDCVILILFILFIVIYFNRK